MSAHPMTAGRLREILRQVTDKGEIAVLAGGETYIITNAIIAIQDDAIVIQCQKPTEPVKALPS